TREKKKYGEIALAQWTPANIARLQDEYRRQTRTTERYWDDVKVGDPLGPLLRGPLTPTAEIAFESFFGIYLVGHIVAARLYDQHPAPMDPTAPGVPRPPQRGGVREAGRDLQPGARPRPRRPADRPGRAHEPGPHRDHDRRPPGHRSRRPPLRGRRGQHAAPVRYPVGQPGARLVRGPALQ